ncbi:hypothetical protein EDD15DRAFT_2359232 [Pisolithus albus]|nr:hypothetical protein EDD15DRAFT_2359232 [Pisolithus albus]
MSMRATPSIDRVHLQVCDLVLVTVLMAKSCTKKRATPQVADGLQPALNNPVVDQTRCSSRANKGSGGQIAQLQNIERIQTQAVARVSLMDVATANEPRNPLAPPSDKQLPQWKTCHLNGRAEEKARLILVVLPFSDSLTSQIPSDAPVHAPTASIGGNTLLRPTCQVPIPGSRYGFRLPTPTADSATSCGDSTVPHRSASAIQSSRQSSTHPASHGHSATPVSRGGTPITMLTPPVPLRSLQIVQCAYNSQTCQLSRTFSVRDLNTASQPQNFFDQDVSVSMPPPYYHAGEDGDTECVDDHDSFPSQCRKFPVSGDTDIDNISPDEDERTAEAALHTTDSRSQGANVNSVNSCVSTLELGQFYHGEDNQDSHALPATCPTDSQIDPALLTISEQHHGEDSDVVRAYHQRNGFPHVPAPERLRAIHDQQQPSSGITISMPAQDVACGVAQSSQLPPESTGPPTTVLLTADGELMGHPTKLRSYPNKFQEVIERAKLIVQCDSATKNPFPSCSTFLDIMSGEIFNEALVKCTNTPPGYWPNYRSQLGILLWKLLMTWRSTIKAKAREVLLRFYDVGAHCTEAENQSQSQALIKGAMFLRDGVDNEGSTNNMAHPALAALVTDFFYSSSSIGAVFPEVFSCEVPRVAMCLAATALQAALDEYTQTGIRQDCPFEYGTYSKIFVGFLDMQHQIDQHPRHAAKTQELRVAWASAGRCETARRNFLPASTHPKARTE